MWVHVHVYGYKVCTHTTNKVYVLTKFHNMEQHFNSHSNCAVQVNNNMKGEVNTVKRRESNVKNDVKNSI